MCKVVECEKLTYIYDNGFKALDDLSLSIKKGEFIGVIGANGGGKSTFIKHLNALFRASGGSVKVIGLELNDKNNIKKIREKVGMVFQNPDNQFVSSVVWEDLAFGPRNLKVNEEEIDKRIKEALEVVDMCGFENKSTHFLSGGQKQKIALAGVLTSNPEIIVFDEVTSMLDYKGRKEVLALIDKLHKEGKTIIMVSHYVEECVKCDRVLLINNGRQIAFDRPRNVFCDKKLLNDNNVDVPLSVKLYYDLLERGIKLPFCPLDNEEFVEALCQLS